MATLKHFNEYLNEFQILGGGSCEETQINSVTGEISCECVGCLRWKEHLKGDTKSGPRYEVFTIELINGLSRYVIERAAAYGLSQVSILEVGAGNGLLSYHLTVKTKEILDSDQNSLEIKFTATDINPRKSCYVQVECEEAQVSIQQRNPHIVLCSWMPMGVDWSEAMRKTKSVKEYILIGETDNGICGHPKLTWNFKRGGSEASDWSSESYSSDEDGAETAGERNGDGNGSGRVAGGEQADNRDLFERVELEWLSKFQICRTDERWSTWQHSHTVSFRRVQQR